MSYLTGGETGKLGDHYEDNILIFYLSKLLKGEVLSIQSESYDEEDEKGTDIIITYNDGTKIFSQAKSRNGNEAIWELKDLKTVIKNACFQILRGYKFEFVSPFHIPFIEDICRGAVQFEKYDEFEKRFINESNAKLFASWKKEIEKHFNGKDIILFFKNFIVTVLPDNTEWYKDFLQNSAQTEQKEETYNALLRYFVKNKKFSQAVYQDELRQYLISNGIKFFSVDSENCGKIIVDIRSRFFKALERKLINKEIIKRRETERVFETLKTQPLVILHGKAGAGKSGVVCEIIERFDREKVCYIPVSFETIQPKVSTHEYGKSLGLPTSPIRTIKKLAGNRETYIIIDQMDAIDWNACSADSVYNVCCDLIKECVDNGVKIIIACRTIDAYKIIGFWDENAPDYTNCSVQVGDLLESNVRKILGDRYETLSSGVKKMLSNINNLKMFLDLNETEAIHTSSDLIKKFIDSKINEVVKRGFNEQNVRGFHQKIIQIMLQKKSTVVRLNDLNSYRIDLIYAFESVGMIEKAEKDQIRFSHQSVRDYCFAEKLINESMHTSLIKILKKYNNSAIENYEIIKQFLELKLYDEDDDFSAQMLKVLFSKQIRRFIKQIVLESMATSKPNDNLNKALYKIILSKEYGYKYLYFLTQSNPNFAEYFTYSNAFDGLTKDYNNKEKMSKAINVVFNMPKNKRYVELLKKIADGTDDRDLIFNIYHRIYDDNPLEEAFDLKIDICKRIDFELSYVNWKSMNSNHNYGRMYKYLKLILSTAQKRHSLIDELYGKEYENSIFEIVKINPNEIFNLSFRYLSNDENRWSFDYGEISASYQTRLAVVEKMLIKSLEFLSPIDLFEKLNTDSLGLKHAILKSSINIDKKVEFVKLLIEKEYILTQDYNEDREQIHLLCKIFNSTEKQLDDPHFSDLVSQMKRYKSPSMLNMAKRRFELRKEGYYYHYSEEERKVFLDSVSFDRFDKYTQEYYRYLCRKFNRLKYYGDRGPSFTSYTVTCVIKNKWIDFEEKTWRKIITSNRIGIKETGGPEGRSVWDFAQVISTAASIRQKLFVRIALSERVRVEFARAICDGFSDNNNSFIETYEKEKPGIFEEATFEEKLEVFKKYFDITDKRILLSFVRFIEKSDETNEWVHEKLLEIATHPEKYEDSKMNVYSFDWDKSFESLTPHDLQTEKINRVQTIAIDCLAGEIYKTKTLSKEMSDILENCLTDEHPVMRFSAIDIICPIYNFDKEFSVKTFIEICQKDLRAFLSYRAMNFLNYIVKENHKELQPFFDAIIDRNYKDKNFIESNIVYYYCWHGCLGEVVAKLIEKDDSGVINDCVRVIKENTDEDILNRARRLILKASKRINKIKLSSNAIDLISGDDSFDLESDKEYVLKILKSCKVLDDITQYQFVEKLSKYATLIDKEQLIFEFCNKTINSMQKYYTETEKLISALIRLYYESKKANNKKIMKRCLKYIDRIFTREIVRSYKVVEEKIQ